MRGVMKKCVIAAIIMMAAVSFVHLRPALADMAAGIKAYKVGDYKTALTHFRTAAEKDNTIAQFFLGKMYDKGQGVPQNAVEAFDWYRKSAEGGDDDAQYFVGLFYEKGKGVSKDYKKALAWYRKSAQQGDRDAQFKVAYFCSRGFGIKRNDEEAVRWYQKAGNQGEVTAQFNLGIMYEYGRGVGKNDVLAVKWYQRAARQGYADAQTKMGYYYATGKGGLNRDNVKAHMWSNLAAAAGAKDAVSNKGVIEKRLTSAQLAKARRLASAFKPIKEKPPAQPQKRPKGKGRKISKPQASPPVAGKPSGHGKTPPGGKWPLRPENFNPVLVAFRAEASQDFNKALATHVTPHAAKQFKDISSKVWPTLDWKTGWNHFFKASFFGINYTGTHGALVAFYSPWLDVFLLTHWKLLKDNKRFHVSELELLAGDFLRRRGRPPFSPVPDWLRTTAVLPQITITQSAYRAFEAFHKAFPPARTKAEAREMARLKSWREQLPRLEDHAVMKANYACAAALLETGLVELAAFFESRELSPVRRETEKILKRLHQGKLNAVLKTANKTTPAMKKFLSRHMSGHWDKLEPVQYVDSERHGVLFTFPSRHPELSIAFTFRKHKAGPSLMRIDAIDFRAHMILQEALKKEYKL
jgi:hypothetical protein